MEIPDQVRDDILIVIPEGCYRESSTLVVVVAALASRQKAFAADKAFYLFERSEL